MHGPCASPSRLRDREDTGFIPENKEDAMTLRLSCGPDRPDVGNDLSTLEILRQDGLGSPAGSVRVPVKHLLEGACGPSAPLWPGG